MLVLGGEAAEGLGHLLVGVGLLVLLLVRWGCVGRGVRVGLKDRALQEVTQLSLAALLDAGDLDRLFGEADLSPAAVRRVQQSEHVLETRLP